MNPNFKDKENSQSKNEDKEISKCKNEDKEIILVDLNKKIENKVINLINLEENIKNLSEKKGKINIIY